jgi:hypothetical protein
MHRYQVAKYVIFDKYFSIQGKFYKNSKILKCGCRKNSVCISCEGWLFCWRVRMSLKSRPNGLDQKLILMPQQKTIILRS